MTMKMFMEILLGLFLLLGLTGCVSTLYGEGRAGFEQSTRWGFYSEAKTATPEMKAEAELKSQPLLDYLAKDAKTEPPTEVEP